MGNVYVTTDQIARRFGVTVATVRLWARTGVLPPARRWKDKGEPYVWDDWQLNSFQPPRVLKNVVYGEDWDSAARRASVGASSDLSHSLASEGRIGSGGLDLSEGHASEDTVMLSPSEAARWIASRWEVSERTGRNWINARHELLQTGARGTVGIPLAALERLKRPARGRPSRKRP